MAIYQYQSPADLASGGMSAKKKNWITAPEVLLAKYDSWSETLMQLSNKISADDLKVKQVNVRAFIFTSEFIVISLIVLKDS